MMMEVTCVCGWQIRGTEDEVIAGVQAHGREVHQVETSADEVRAIWHPVPDEAAGGPAAG